MDRYLVETQHSPDECLHAVDLVISHGYITHYDWGCYDGVHTGWVILEADSHEEAMLSVPTLLRNKARAIKLNKFTPEEIRSLHGKK